MCYALDIEFCFCKCGWVDNCGVGIKNGVGKVVKAVDSACEPVVTNLGACLLDAVGFHLRRRFLKTGEVIVRLVLKITSLWERVEVDVLREHFVGVEPVVQVLGCY